MDKCQSNSVGVGIGAFLAAEAALLLVGKFKFENTWALIKWTPAAMAAGGLVGYAVHTLSADKTIRAADNVLNRGPVTLDNITADDIDRIEAHIKGGGQITDKDRVAVVCLFARMVSNDENENFEKVEQLIVAKGWQNDPVWNGKADSPRGKLITTISKHANNLSGFVQHGFDPMQEDCENISGYSRLDAEHKNKFHYVFIMQGQPDHVISWLSTVPVEERESSWLEQARNPALHSDISREPIVTWMETNGFN